MHRTQILLDEWQYERLRAQAEREERSLAELVREAVGAYLAAPEGRADLGGIVGIGADPGLSGADHDLVLYGAGPGSERAGA